MVITNVCYGLPVYVLSPSTFHHCYRPYLWAFADELFFEEVNADIGIKKACILNNYKAAIDLI